RRDAVARHRHDRYREAPGVDRRRRGQHHHATPRADALQEHVAALVSVLDRPLPRAEDPIDRLALRLLRGSRKEQGNGEDNDGQHLSRIPVASGFSRKMPPRGRHLPPKGRTFRLKAEATRRQNWKRRPKRTMRGFMISATSLKFDALTS